MAMIFVAILMPFRITLLLFFLSLAIHIIINIASPFSNTMTSLSPLIVFVVTSSLLIVFIAYRNGLERERRVELEEANRRLRASEIELEHRVEDRTRELVVAKDSAE